MEFVYILIASVIFFILGRMSEKKKPVGTLRIDHTNPEKDIYRFDIEDLDKLNSVKRIVIDVKHTLN